MTEIDLDHRRQSKAATAELRADVVAGLTAARKWLPVKWFYDDVGSELFEKITQLPEYYPTRCEREVLATHAGEVAALTGARTLIELGSGSSEKTRLLLDALSGHGTLTEFVPLDVSESALAAAAGAISGDYPGLTVRGVIGDFTQPLDRLPGDGPRLVAFLGGTFGNFLPEERAALLRSLRGVLAPGGWLLLGTDLVKAPDVLERAYDDAAGVTAAFDKNVLRVINDRLGADFDLDEFEHVSCWDAEHEWIEMRLRASRALTIEIPGAGLTVRFAAGEHIRTEISAKFRQGGVDAELSAAGFALDRWWTDSRQRYGVSLAQAVLPR
ncbi:L-histidine N(alpha)-methyltransferase [Amycolatopsis sp. WQ 127309]|uniref:L-histidine N(alpha)-methyltransferase n=1 Tax=Amycolatopsis sp. WQ 127309 TaxID=2932773 RepID=UPI001FF49108|nr:L-histidine N(alpha)-methyltransferase [Amycolatopsis sp. WQ 127309]UOZ06932.1 L-histidine N(alpha)-methyltransferase [Amycolatopsis sp. WQ 127309]